MLDAHQFGGSTFSTVGGCEAAHNFIEHLQARFEVLDGYALIDAGFCQLRRQGVDRNSGCGASRLSGFQDAERDGCSAHVLKAPRGSRNVLAHVGSAAEKVS